MACGDDVSTNLSSRYGKDKVRVLRVVREDDWHRIVEYNVTALVEGDIDVSYTQGDNSVVVATDSIKNIIYYLSKISPHILYPERFALHIGTHLVSRYDHIHKAYITIEQLRWTRMPAVGVDLKGKEHPHSFIRDGNEKRIVHAEVDATTGKDQILGRVSAGMSDLLVLKSTGSSFAGFIRDEYTTLSEVSDRIFSTSIELEYTFAPVQIEPPVDQKKLNFALLKGYAIKGQGGMWDAEYVAENARQETLEIFASDNSASVQATLYKMAQRVLSRNSGIQSATYRLPNQHYIPVDMRYIGLENVSPSSAEVFVPISAPSGLISATLTKKDAN